MTRRRLSSLLPDIYDAALHPEAWGSVMRSLSRLTGAIGSGYIVLSKRTNRVVAAEVVGIAEELAEDYVQHYSRSDPYWLTMHRSNKRWYPLSKLRAEIDLTNNEWYNDFVCKLPIREIMGIKLVETPGLVACMGFQYGTELSKETHRVLAELKEPLTRAALIDMEMRSRKWQAEIAGDIVEQLSIGVVIINDAGRVVEMNPMAERIIARGDGFNVRGSRVVLARSFEAAKFEAHLAAVLLREWNTEKIARLLVGRPEGKRPYTVTLVPSTKYAGSFGRTYAIVLISDPDIEIPTEAELAELFGLSPAESRLAIALVEGRTLPDIAAAAGLKLTTLRTQMQSIFKKVGVERQSELLLTLLRRFWGRHVR